MKAALTVDQDQKILPYDITGLWRAVEKNPSLDVFFNRLIQWNDGWLMVVLKKAFLEMDDNTDDILKDRFKELLAGEKHYYSIVKSAQTFREIEQKFILTVKDDIEEIKEYLREISELSEQMDKKKESLRIKPLCDDLNAMIRLIESYSDRTFREKGFILGRISRLIFENYYEEEVFQNLVRDSVNQIKSGTDIRDIIVVFKKIKTGIRESLMLYDRDAKLISFKNISNTEIDLKIQQEFVPPFFIYVNTDRINSIDYNDIRDRIGEKIGESIVAHFRESMKTWIEVLKEEEEVQCAQ